MHSPKRTPRRYRVRRLEPRIVLNATAELSVLGELLIGGDGADDTLDIETNPNGRLEIRDANGAVIPIRLAGGLGVVNSIAPSQITSERISVNLGGGDDILRVDLPENLDLRVIDGDGNDSVEVNIASNDNSAEVTLEIEAESIEIDGQSNALDLSSGSLIGVGPNGSVTIDNTLDLVLGTTQSTGEVTINANGNVTTGLIEGTNIDIVATGPQSDILVGELRVNDPSSGVIELTAGDDILRDGPNSPDVVANQLILRAGNAELDGPTAIALNTRVEVLDAVVQGSNEGDLVINEADDLRLAVLDSSDGNAALETGNGLIRVTTGGSLRVDDFAAVEDGPSLAGNPDIIAGGASGGIELEVGQDFIAGDSVQLSAPGSDGSVRIEATDEVILGNDFEINVQAGEGIARQFTPRPDPNDLQPAIIQDSSNTNAPTSLDPSVVEFDTAFYDVDSVTTDILTQANDNDATGTLSIDIGAEGENGLVLFIDWGGFDNPFNDRFQTEEGLAGNRTQVDFTHVYTQQDILDSRLNGRPSATDPLAVRFAVSHHRSIVVMGNVVQQPIDLPGFDTVREAVPSRLLSSTDNPATPETANPGLENGRAFFVIPRIDVPVAFFPNRDVIPEAVDPPPPVLTSSVLMLADVSLETAESSGTSITIREEYFQLRALSPDPAGENLSEPVRLPESVLSGNNLSELFSKLPDGAYEVQYVLGDSDERTILRVDLRGGEPIIVGDDLDGEPLEIRWIEGGPDEQPNDEPMPDPASDRLRENLPAETDTSFAPTSTNGIANESGVPESDVPTTATTSTHNPFSRASRLLATLQNQQPAIMSETDR